MDYQVKVRVRNGRIVKRMRECGFDTLAALVRHIDGSKAGSALYISFVRLLGMKETALSRKGHWRPVVLRLCAALNCPPDELFNEQQKTAPLHKNNGEAFMDLPEVLALIGSGGIDAVEAHCAVDKLLSTLKPRSEQVMRLRLGGATHREVGEEIGVRPERARQIEARAFMDMQKAAKPKRLPVAA